MHKNHPQKYDGFNFSKKRNPDFGMSDGVAVGRHSGSQLAMTLFSSNLGVNTFPYFGGHFRDPSGHFAFTGGVVDKRGAPSALGW